MTAHIERRTSRIALWSRRIALFSLVLFLVAILGHRRGLVETPAFLWVLAIVACLALLALLLVALGFRGIWIRGHRGGLSAALATGVAILVLVPFAIPAAKFFLYPRLDDISTDLIDPPALAAAARTRGEGMNPIRPIARAAADLQIAAYPEITGRRYGASPDRVLQAVDAVIADEGWIVVSRPPMVEGESEYTLEAVARTFLLGLPCDVAVRLTDEGETTYVDMRSASRYGPSDFGDNASRIAGFLDALDAEMADQAGR